MRRYNPLFEETNELLYEGQFSKEKPKIEPGYKITRGMGRDPENPKKVIKGWIKTKVKKTTTTKTKRSKASYRKAAKKAGKTRKRDISGQKKALKKRKKTLKMKKAAGIK